MNWTRIGLLGGTFDPIHIGHLVAAVNARHQCDLDVVLMEVAASPWQKVDSREIVDAEIRFEMVQAAVEGVDGLVASRLEIERGGMTYSIDTLRQLRSIYPHAELFLIGGSDMAAGLDGWRKSDAVADLADFIWVNRPGVEPFALDVKWRVHHVHMPPVDLSSSELRRRVGLGEPVDFLVPPRVFEVIVNRGLYAVEVT